MIFHENLVDQKQKQHIFPRTPTDIFWPIKLHKCHNSISPVASLKQHLGTLWANARGSGLGMCLLEPCETPPVRGLQRDGQTNWMDPHAGPSIVLKV